MHSMPLKGSAIKMNSCYFCTVLLFLVFVSSSSIPREQEEEKRNLLFYNQRTKNVNYTISKVSQASYEGVNQTFIQRHRRNAQGNNFRHPTQCIKSMVNLQQYISLCFLYVLKYPTVIPWQKVFLLIFAKKAKNKSISTI